MHRLLISNNRNRLTSLAFVAAVALGWLCCSNPSAAQQSGSQEQLDFFEKKIRPVLVQHCYQCHSGEAEKSGHLEGGLMLDSRDLLRQGGESGPVVIPGKSSESLLLSALQYESLEMPPSGPLPESIIADFAKWIDSGAPDPRDTQPTTAVSGVDLEKGRRFWAFQPLANAPQELLVNDGVLSVDFFIAEKQEALGLRMSPPASPRVLIRRAWFDLLGIPPSPEELDHWTQRLSMLTTPTQPVNRQAWSELVDHLLDRPEYGERWARHWMDIARFAESYGYEQDYDRPNAFHYRDFLIQAFNSDLPYDQFVQWQIAGDQLAPENPLAWMATGFLGAGAFPTQLTEAEFESARYDELDDMVSTLGVAFLGLSIGCARCHDHKFDPLASEDYYRLAATFTHTIRAEKSFDLDPAGNRQREADFDRKLQAAQEQLDQYAKSQLPQEFRDWLASQGAEFDSAARWQVLSGQLTSSQKHSFELLSDGSYRSAGTAPAKEILTFDGGPFSGVVHALRIEALADPSLPHQGPGRAANGNFALGNLVFESVDESGRSEQIKLTSPRATFQQNDNSLSIAASIDSDAISGWAVDGQIGRDHAAVFDLQPPMTLNGDRHLRITLTFNHPNGNHAMGRVRFSVTSNSDAVAEVGFCGPPAVVTQALKNLATSKQSSQTPLSQSKDWQVALDWFKSRSPTWIKLADEVASLKKSGPMIKLTPVMVCSEGLPHLPHHADDRGYPHFYPETYFLRRGDVHQKVGVVEPGFPQVLQPELPPLDAIDSNSTSSAVNRTPRAALAHWLTDTNAGPGDLVARVIVNRLWQHHFGRGIVATPNDFGEMGDRPTNPALLDWLAQRLLAEQWRLKPLHRVIMTSQTYMQSDKDESDARSQIDPENICLWHRAPQRLEAEAIRDAMLAVSGQLDSTMFGPGSLDQKMKRRSIYFFIKRSQLIPCMMLFDWPEHLVSIGQRSTTTIAPQALMFMNNEQVREYAEAFARRILASDRQHAVQSAYALAFGRQPSAAERQVALDFMTRAQDVRTGRGEADAELQATADFCQMLLGASEFIYVD